MKDANCFDSKVVIVTKKKVTQVITHAKHTKIQKH